MPLSCAEPQIGRVEDLIHNRDGEKDGKVGAGSSMSARSSGSRKNIAICLVADNNRLTLDGI